MLRFTHFQEKNAFCDFSLKKPVLLRAEMSLFFCHFIISASARISKGQGYQGFLRKRAGSSFGQKRAICVVQG
jgi:hypothetical protein